MQDETVDVHNGTHTYTHIHTHTHTLTHAYIAYTEKCVLYMSH